MLKAQEVKDVAVVRLSQAIEEEKKEQWRAEGRSMLFDAKRVNNENNACIISTVLLHSLTPGFRCSLFFRLAYSESHLFRHACLPLGEASHFKACVSFL